LRVRKTLILIEEDPVAISQIGGVIEDLAAAWTAHDVDKVLALCTDDCVYEDVTMAVVNRGKGELKAFAGKVFGAFPDFTMTLSLRFVAEHQAAAEWTMSGTHKGDLPGMPATGKAFSVRGASICELRDGKISRNADYWDMATFLKQVGRMA
jgi:steroid delta-isomerase-like uncharacterized protein